MTKLLNRKFYRIIFLSVFVSLLLISGISPADADSITGDTVVTLGADLTAEQRSTVFQLLNAPENTNVLTVTNEEEHQMLGQYLGPAVIGNKAVSSAKVILGEPGSGLQVTTNNITWVSKEMYVNAMVTAGVKDAEVIVAAPFPVSGTAALTGITKAFEKASDNKLSADRIDAANEELVKTAELAEQIGDPMKASQLLAELKKELSKVNPQTDNAYRTLIQKVAQDLNVNLTDDQINSLIELLKKIKSLNIDWSSLANQLADIHQKFQEVMANDPEARSLWDKIVGFFKQIGQIISGLLS
jgi:uncharacterized protein YpuA (DUF1002 family)